MTQVPQNSILHIVVPTPLHQHFEYLPPENYNPAHLQPGVRVLVPFGRRQLVGIILKINQHSDFGHGKLKRVISILDEQPVLSENLIALTRWASDYYHHPIGEVMLSSLPGLLRQGKNIDLSSFKIAERNQLDNLSEVLPLNKDQQRAVNAVIASKGFQTFLLDGVTGSGKTEVYLRSIDHVLQQKKQALVLVPEIGLTPQTVARFQERFNVTIAIFHSKLTEKERLKAWALTQNGQAAIIIGTRSAIFNPMANPGIIILDEEHDLSFKQQSSLRYSARDLAVMRAHLENIPVILGTATPSLESLHNVNRGRFQHLQLPERAGLAKQPTFKIINLRDQRLEHGLSKPLLSAMEKHLQEGNQVLLFLNRRGFAPTLLCLNCGWSAQCKNCDARMNLHHQPPRLFCHHCGVTSVKPDTCPSCKQPQLLLLGMGTERVEQTLIKYFPKYNIARIDKDNTRRKGAMQKMLNDINEGNSQILIGTQMLAKGHHFPNVTMVAILDADSGLYSSDFRASERMGQLIVQVSGRAGRADKPGEVYIQTHHPEHPLLMQLIQCGYQDFAKTILLERKKAKFPPFSYLALVRAETKQQIHAMDFLQKLRKHIEQQQFSVQLLGPVPAIMERKAGTYRAQLLIQSQKRSDLQQALRILILKSEAERNSKVRWSVDVDPVETI